MNEQEMEKWKAQNRSQLAEYNARCAAELAYDIEMLKSTNTAGQAALKSAILINGGAAVALLAFIGHVVTALQESEKIINKLEWSIGYFVGGVLIGAIACGVVYLTQFAYSYNKRRVGHILNGISWLLVILCYVFFLIGVILAFKVF